jgi:hypothetical protein
VEGAVGDDLVLDVPQRLAGHQAEEMVPLQDLVQQDAVEEAAEREADHTAGHKKAAPAGEGRACRRTALVRHAHGAASGREQDEDAPARPQTEAPRRRFPLQGAITPGDGTHAPRAFAGRQVRC